MNVFKFGGASVRNAEGIRNATEIIRSFSSQKLLVVISAMGKTTNLLEKILSQAYENASFADDFAALKNYHLEVAAALFKDPAEITRLLEVEFAVLAEKLKSKEEFDQLYDQVVSHGELLSTKIIHQFLLEEKLPSTWIDAREFVQTDSSFREGKVNWQATNHKISTLRTVVEKTIVITQGFIGSSPDGLTVTLGRDGSDFSAAIFAAALNASALTIWKDVPGVMNADPKRLPAAVVFEELPFREAAEMTYYGASVIHPKTIKPLANKGIPLLVKSFENPSLPGTRIHECRVDNLPPLIVFKDNQCLISCRVTDYTFISEQQLSSIFSALADLDVKINVLQNSAISFSFCVDYRESKVKKLVERLQKNFEVYYNLGLTLITIKNYDTHTFETYRKKPGILLEQSSRSTLQLLLRI